MFHTFMMDKESKTLLWLGWSDISFPFWLKTEEFLEGCRSRLAQCEAESGGLPAVEGGVADHIW